MLLNRKKAVLVVALLVALLMCQWPFVALAGVANTKHNLAAWSGNTVRALTETRICRFCHTPHNANPAVPLWSHELSTQTFLLYTSKTLVIDNPSVLGLSQYKSGLTGTSKLCMGCHDGVTGLGAMSNGWVIDMNYTNLGSRASAYGNDLRNKHPVSFIYDGSVKTQITNVKGNIYGLPSETANNTIVNPAVLAKWNQENQRVECTICHDPHDDLDGDPTKNPFWVSTSVGAYTAHDSVCVSCHSYSFGEYTGFGEYTSFDNK